MKHILNIPIGVKLVDVDKVSKVVHENCLEQWTSNRVVSKGLSGLLLELSKQQQEVTLKTAEEYLCITTGNKQSSDIDINYCFVNEKDQIMNFLTNRSKDIVEAAIVYMRHSGHSYGVNSIKGPQTLVGTPILGMNQELIAKLIDVFMNPEFDTIAIESVLLQCDDNLHNLIIELTGLTPDRDAQTHTANARELNELQWRCADNVTNLLHGKQMKTLCRLMLDSYHHNIKNKSITTSILQLLSYLVKHDTATSEVGSKVMFKDEPLDQLESLATTSRGCKLEESDLKLSTYLVKESIVPFWIHSGKIRDIRKADAELYETLATMFCLELFTIRRICKHANRVLKYAKSDDMIEMPEQV